MKDIIMSKKYHFRPRTMQKNPQADEPIQPDSPLHRLLTLIACRMATDSVSLATNDEEANVVSKSGSRGIGQIKRY